MAVECNKSAIQNACSTEKSNSLFRHVFLLYIFCCSENYSVTPNWIVLQRLNWQLHHFLCSSFVQWKTAQFHLHTKITFIDFSHVIVLILYCAYSLAAIESLSYIGFVTLIIKFYTFESNYMIQSCVNVAIKSNINVWFVCMRTFFRLL